MKRIATFFLVPLSSLWACHSNSPCHAPAGQWESEDGHILVFETSGKGLWIDRFGTQSDTVPFEFRLDCQNPTPAFDLYNFISGPYRGKTLFGILDWQSDTSFRLRAEVGDHPSVRPADFDEETTERFVKISPQ